MRLSASLVLVASQAWLASAAIAQTDPLASWNDGAAKQSILKFVADTTADGAPGFVAPAERIAVFDNDGTLWSEQPLTTRTPSASLAYDRQSSIGKLDQALDEALAKGWTVVDMKKDWNRVHPFDK